VIKHFPELAPPKNDAVPTGAPSKTDQFVAQLLENLKNPYDTIKAKDLHERLQTEQKPVVIDIRVAQDYQAAHIPGAVNIPQDDIADRIGELPADRDAPIVTVCNIGKFSKHVTLLLKSKGYRNVRSAKGGLDEWVRKGFETTS
jgi:rhodanese-related sulfurtransferase